METKEHPKDQFLIDVIVRNVILSYCQPFEIAIVTDVHTQDSYMDAAKHGHIEYLTAYRSDESSEEACQVAAEYGQIDAIKMFIPDIKYLGSCLIGGGTRWAA